MYSNKLFAISLIRYELPKNFEVADADFPEVSSTEVRDLLEAGEPFEHLMMPKAAEYLKKNGLYGYKQYL